MKSVILLSGGLDSAVILAQALDKGRKCFCLSFDYGQRHRIELECASKIAAYYKVSHKILSIDPQTFGKNSLVDGIDVLKNRTLDEITKKHIPNSYVPARNTLFLAYAMAQAELYQAEEIYAGMNALDINYPDCLPAYISAFQNLLNVATKQANEGLPPKLITPLLHMDKVQIVLEAISLKVPISLTSSCYDPVDKTPCHQCDACILRDNAFQKAGLTIN